jgi:hypothetical protein
MADPLKYPPIPEVPKSKENKMLIGVVLGCAAAPVVLFIVLVAIKVVFNLVEEIPSVISQINSQAAQAQH